MTAERDRVVVADPCRLPNPALVVAGARAGALGVVDLPDGTPAGDATAVLTEVSRRIPTDMGFAVRCSQAPGDLPDLPDQVDTVMVTGAVGPWCDAQPGRRILAEVTSVADARAAVAAGAAGLVAKGSESGGPVGDVEAFVLAQQVADLGVPFWVSGGIGLHTAAAPIVGGAAGVVLDGQLALVRESMLDDDARDAVAAMDGSETRVVGGHRIYVRPDLQAVELAEDEDIAGDAVAARFGPRLRRDILPLGQDAAAARRLAERHHTVGGVVQALRDAIDEHLRAAQEHQPLAPGAGLARAHRTRYPIAQGPMTRVSDKADFAAAVAEAGGLPFLALALLSGPDVRALLEDTAVRLGERPWGVGVLGFVPPDVRSAQLEVIQDLRPPVALVAGGRPSQAVPLEEAGIATFLHVPSPGLLARFLREGARRFVFEGRECGGHVGPRASFPLWDAQVGVLCERDDLHDVEVLFAGGIHDACSAAMVATVAAPLAARGARVGVLMGTAYLFTEQAVAVGAITAAFQDVAHHCDATVLLETAPGHITRCAETDYVRAFAARKAELVGSGTPADAMWAELEALNLGRLRVASKGLAREGDQLVKLDEHRQRQDGLYMLGQVATLRRDRVTVAELHEEVSAGSTAYLEEQVAEHRPAEPRRTPSPSTEVAIVGMAAVFPGAADVEQYWANVLAGVDCITEVPRRRWNPDTFYDPEAVTKDAGRKTPSRWGGFLPAVPFDALAYGIPPRSLAAIESVQLLSLEVAGRALQDAGYDTRAFDRGRTSVIFGAEGGNDLSHAYGFRAAHPHYLGALPSELETHLPAPTEDSFPGVLTNVIAGRIANRLDLGGVNYTVDAACAASLAALDTACKELAGGSSDMVLCGGADVHNGIHDYLLFASVHALSPSGRCRTFDAAADGIALGEGIACLVLKRLADAERDGDRIYAVVAGVGGSSDGRHLGLTAPRQEGQERALHRAYDRAEIDPSTVGLVEAHGTGTVVGDRTELAALTGMFADAGAVPGGTVLGSVKSQIGHTKCTAGLAGVIKTARALHAGVLPPTRNIDQPNDYFEAATSPFRFLDRPVPWPGAPRRAGVSAFGFGGTNFHAVLRAHDDQRPEHGVEVWPAELFLVRAPSAEAAPERLADLRATLTAIATDDPAGQRHRLRDLAAAVCSRGSGPVQLACVASSLDDLLAQVTEPVPGSRDWGALSGAGSDPGDGGPRVAFLHPGQGSQRPGMLADLFVTFPGLQSVLAGGRRWLGSMFPGTAFSAEELGAQAAALTDTRVAQPALAMAASALTRLLRLLGVEPGAAGGHSFGELAALATAGAIDEATLLDLAAARGEAMAAAAARGGDAGTMAAVSLSAAELQSRGLPADVVVANHNGPRQTVVSGPTEAVEALVAELKAERVGARRLDVAAAFHSPLVAEASTALAEQVDRMAISAPTLPVWSNVTAEPYPEDPGKIRELLAEQVRRPVRFVEQIEAMYADGIRVFVEVGPGQVLTQLVDRILADRPHLALACDIPGEPGVTSFLKALAALAAAGVPVDHRPLFRGRVQRLDWDSLPLPAPDWVVDGHLVCTRDGEPVEGGLQPADRIPETAPATTSVRASTALDDTVQEYLRSTTQVMLQYLGASTAGAPAVLSSNGRRTNGTGGSDANGHEPVPADPPDDVVPAALVPLAAGTADPEVDLLTALLGIVSEQTGYPREMLDPDLDLEADLSIDSIKRMEIIGELADRVELSGATGQGLDEALVEELTQLKTLREVVAWIDERDPPAAPAEAASADEPALVALDRAAAQRATRRYVVETVRLDPALPTASPAGQVFAVVGDEWAGTDALRRRLEQAGAARVEVIGVHRGAPRRPLPDDLARRLAQVDGIVHLGGAAVIDPVDARDVFAMLRPALEGRATTLVAASAPGAASGVAGLLRTLARELPGRHVRAVELDLAEDPDAAARRLADETLDPSGPVAVAYRDALRTTRRLGPGVPVSELPARSLPLDQRSVVVVTGGARGITARAALALADTTGCRLALLGRSPLPDDEDPRTVGHRDRPALTRALAELGGLGTPAEIADECDRILAAREIRGTLARLRELECDASYHPVDVRDAAALAFVLDEIRRTHGRIDAVVHGAGVLDDRLARDKTDVSFDRVFATKVDGARALLDRLDRDVRLVVLFGSVSGVFGNPGQVDYAAANAALDELAVQLDGSDGRRVVSVDWGPWADGGMVTPELQREYERRGVGLVDPDEGVAALLHEMAGSAGDPTQVVVMRADPEAFSAPAAEPAEVADLAVAVAAGG